jgi:hypothetical protein
MANFLWEELEAYLPSSDMTYILRLARTSLLTTQFLCLISIGACSSYIKFVRQPQSSKITMTVIVKFYSQHFCSWLTSQPTTFCSTLATGSISQQRNDKEMIYIWPKISHLIKAQAETAKLFCSSLDTAPLNNQACLQE